MSNMIKPEYIKEADKKRKEWASGDAKRDAGLIEPVNVIAVKNLTYTESETEKEEIWHKTDVYYPDIDMDKYPVLVSIHGGGWFYGDKELYRFYCMELAKSGFAVVNFNYRLSPEYIYPSGFMDVCKLMNYLLEKRDILHLDMDNLFITGDSAGAQLCSQYSVWATNEEYHRLIDPDFKIAAPVPKRIALNCGIYDMRVITGRDELCKWYLPEGLDETTNLGKSYYGILDYVTSNFPETYLMLSVNDDLRIHTPVMKELLEKNGIKFVFREFGEGSPKDGHVFHVNMKSELGKQCNKEEIEFFKNGLAE